jgi:hypothetical protein
MVIVNHTVVIKLEKFLAFMIRALLSLKITTRTKTNPFCVKGA